MASRQIPGTFQGVVQAAIAAYEGNQSALARELALRMGTKVSQQNLSYLAKGKGKLARWSRLTPFLLEIAGLSPTWTPKHPEGSSTKRARKTPKAKGEPLEIAKIVKVKVKETGRIENVELTRDVLAMAKVLMKMDDEDRLAVAQKITALRVRAKSSKDPDPRTSDGALEHLAAPGTPTALRRESRKAAAAKKKVPSPPKHSQ